MQVRFSIVPYIFRNWYQLSHIFSGIFDIVLLSVSHLKHTACSPKMKYNSVIMISILDQNILIFKNPVQIISEMNNTMLYCHKQAIPVKISYIPG